MSVIHDGPHPAHWAEEDKAPSSPRPVVEKNYTRRAGFAALGAIATLTAFALTFAYFFQ